VRDLAIRAFGSVAHVRAFAPRVAVKSLLLLGLVFHAVYILSIFDIYFRYEHLLALAL
jgi:hypothetical protein